MGMLFLVFWGDLNLWLGGSKALWVMTLKAPIKRRYPQVFFQKFIVESENRCLEEIKVNRKKQLRSPLPTKNTNYKGQVKISQMELFIHNR